MMKQVLSQHCIYEAGDKLKGFEYYSEKVCNLKYFCVYLRRSATVAESQVCGSVHQLYTKGHPKRSDERPLLLST